LNNYIVRICQLVLIFLINLCLFSSCTNTCNSEPTANRKVKLGFYKIKGKSLVDTTIDTVFVYNKMDTFFYNAQSVSKINLELDQNHDTSIFYFKTDSITSGITDTLTFTYNRRIQFISSECGFNTIFTSLKLDSNYTTNIIDTILFVSQDIGADIEVNYKMILKVKTK
jgi:hypothetical protein